MKKKLIVLAAAIICLSITVGGTLAYFTARDKAHNVITTGGVGIEIIEKTRGDDGAEVDFPKEGVSGVMPGMAVSKIVSVQNKGDAPAWIRVKVEQSIHSADGGDLPLTLTARITNDDGQIEEQTVPVMAFNAGEKWQAGEDGWYYYTEPVAAGGSTGILFREVTFAAAMGNEYQCCTANLVISAQAVQSANNGETVAEAEGWPQETAEEGGGAS